jgi:membrane-associated phospholipid phosphatase
LTVRRLSWETMPIHNNKWKLTGLLLCIGLAFSILALVAMAEFHEEITEPFLTKWDQLGMQIIHAQDTPALTELALALSWIGAPRVLVPAVTVVSLLLWRVKLKEDAVVLFLAIGSAGVLDTALKLHFRRVRPDVPWALMTEHSFSFPSGHSVCAVVLYGMVTYLLWKHLHRLWERVVVIASALLLIAGIGASRVYIGVHYPSDVAAGYLVGLLWLFTVIATNEYLNWAGRKRMVLDQDLTRV